MADNPVTVREVVASVVSSLGIRSVPGELVGLAQQLQQLRALNQTTAQVVTDNTKALALRGPSNSGSSLADTVLGQFRGGLGVLGVSPILAGLSRLFARGGESEPEVSPFPKFVLPNGLSVVAGQGGQDLSAPFAVEYQQGHVARPVTGSAPQITVQVQAMDSKSFLDRSQDIAQAVRLAMLDSGVLTDLIREA